MPTKDNHWLLRIRRGRPRRGLARRRASCCTDHRWGSEREGRILADSNFWTPSQLVILGSILMLAGLLAVSSLDRG